MDEPIEMDYATYKRTYKEIKDPAGNVIKVVPRQRKRRVKLGVLPAQRTLLEQLVADTGVPIPPEISPKAREYARAMGQKLYWGSDGCKHHGRPMLRRTGDGLCYVCVHNSSVERRQATAQRKLHNRLCIDEMARSAAIAEQRGDKVYWPGIKCKHGHVAERHTANGGCVQCYTERKGKVYVPPMKSRPVPSEWVNQPVWPEDQASKAPDNSTIQRALEELDKLAELTGSAPK